MKATTLHIWVVANQLGNFQAHLWPPSQFRCACCPRSSPLPWVRITDMVTHSYCGDCVLSLRYTGVENRWRTLSRVNDLPRLSWELCKHEYLPCIENFSRRFFLSSSGFPILLKILEKALAQCRRGRRVGTCTPAAKASGSRKLLEGPTTLGSQWEPLGEAWAHFPQVSWWRRARLLMRTVKEGDFHSCST